MKRILSVSMLFLYFVEAIKKNQELITGIIADKTKFVKRRFKKKGLAEMQDPYILYFVR